MTNNGVDKVAEFHRRWDELAEATARQHPAVTEWLIHDARGCVVHPSCDPDDPDHGGRLEWVA